MPGPTRILVVEDDPEVRSAIRMVLEAEAYEVAESGDGRMRWRSSGPGRSRL